MVMYQNPLLHLPSLVGGFRKVLVCAVMHTHQHQPLRGRASFTIAYKYGQSGFFENCLINTAEDYQFEQRSLTTIL